MITYIEFEFRLWLPPALILATNGPGPVATMAPGEVGRSSVLVFPAMYALPALSTPIPSDAVKRWLV